MSVIGHNDHLHQALTLKIDIADGGTVIERIVSFIQWRIHDVSNSKQLADPPQTCANFIEVRPYQPVMSFTATDGRKTDMRFMTVLNIVPPLFGAFISNFKNGDFSSH